MVSTKLYSKTVLAIVLSLITVQVPVQAFSVAEQLGKLKDYVLENPKTAFYTAGGIFLVGSFIAAIRAENAERARSNERYRIAQEHYAQEQKAEQDRIDGLDLDQLIAELIACKISDAQTRWQRAEYAELVQVHTDLLDKPLSDEERKALKEKLRFLCFEQQSAFDSAERYIQQKLNQVLDIIERRVSLDPQAQYTLAIYAEQIETLQKEIHKISAIFNYQAKKEADKKARNTPSEPKVVVMPQAPYYGYNHNWNQNTTVVQPALTKNSKTPELGQPQPVVAQPVVEQPKIVQPSVKTPKVTYDDQTYDILNPYHTLIGD